MKAPAPPRPPRTDVLPEHEEEWADRRWVQQDLANRVLTREHVVRCRLEGCRMTGFEVPDGGLQDVALTGCQWSLGALRMTTLTRVAFTDCDLRELDLYDARLQDVAFTGCDLSRADFSRVRCARVSLRDCTLDGLRGTEGLRGVELAWADVLALAPSLAADAGLVVREDEER